MKTTLTILSTCILACIAGCGTGKPNTIMQVSTIDALLSGAYQSRMSCKKLTSYANFGVGTFDKLDGEMVLLNGKMYHHHTGFIGNLKSISFDKMLEKAPERIIESAVKGMLPKNPLGRAMYKKMKVYAGSEHPHTAQQPKTLDI